MSERTAEEWGRVAVALPGWRWMPGMLTNIGRLCQKRNRPLSQGSVVLYLPGGGSPGRSLVPDPDDPATAGALLALLTPSPPDGYISQVQPPRHSGEMWRIYLRMSTGDTLAEGATLGRACIAAAEALGRWPGVCR